MSENQWFPAKDQEPGVVGRFDYDKILDIPASVEADEERYKQIIVLRERVSGSPDVSVRKVMPHNQKELIQRYPEAWEHFQGKEVVIAGTPLAEMRMEDGSRLTEDRILGLKLQGISTVEQLAGISDQICQNLGFGTRKLRERAQAVIADRDRQRMAMLMAAAPPSAEPVGEAPKRRGRPPKTIAHHA